MSSNKSQFYTNKSIKYLFNKYIAEFDIRRAGLEALRDLKIIDESTYTVWRECDKLQVSKYIGKNLSKHFKVQNDRILEIVDLFIKQNDISPRNIISQKRDAIIAFNIRPNTFNINGFEFVKKHEYSSYFRIENFELYYSSKTDELDIKGIDTTWVKSHALIPYIKKCIQKYEHLNAGFCTYTDVYRFLYDLRKSYLSFQLPIGCYREISYQNPYCFNHIESQTLVRLLGLPQNSDEYQLVINYNFVKFIVPFINILPAFRSSGGNRAKGKSYG